MDISQASVMRTCEQRKLVGLFPLGWERARGLAVYEWKAGVDLGKNVAHSNVWT